jgi:integrase
MTQPAGSTAPTTDCGCALPTASTPVLVHREVLPDVDPATLSVFSDDVWDLSPGVFEAHTTAISLNFTTRPAPLREAAKHYFWQLINHRPPTPLRWANTARLSLMSIKCAFHSVMTFLTWLDVHHISSFDQVTPAHLDRFLNDILGSERSGTLKEDDLCEVRRLWSYRALLPESIRLPAQPLWDGEDTRDLLGIQRKRRENTTPRIHPDTMQALLMWSLRFVEDFAEDIIAAFTEYQRLMLRATGSRHRPSRQVRDTPTRPGWVTAQMDQWLAEQRTHGRSLPGRELPDGSREVDWTHLARVFDCGTASLTPGRRPHHLVLNSSLPIARAAYLDTPITGRLHGHPWLESISYVDAPRLARLLAAAAAVVIGYLSGMRPGELLNLERGCADYDPITRLWFVHGQHWKGVIDDAGEKLPEGRRRPDPWTVVQPVARAVDVLQRLHPHQLLFPAQLRAHGKISGGVRRTERVKGQTPGRAAAAIDDLISWVNDRCQHQDHDEHIPADPNGTITLSRLRRSLAWHIVRRPRGLIAGAIQYGHLYTHVTIGYAGSYESGFPDDHAYEEWLFRLEQLREQHERLSAGDHVSGPAADAYRHRVHTAHAKFAGRVLTTARQAHDMLDNPLLQIFPGRAMTCVLNPQQALCQLFKSEGAARSTPDRDDCRPTCKNLAYTDYNIAELQARANRLREIVADPLAPSPRATRERHELDRIERIIRRHHQGKHAE